MHTNRKEEENLILGSLETMDFGDTNKKIKFEKVFVEGDSLRHRRPRFESLNKPPNFLYSDPPWLSRQLAFTVDDEKDKLDDLVCTIKNGFRKGQIRASHVIDIEKCTKELRKLISTDPRMSDLLEKDFLMRLIQLLKREQNPKLQAHAAKILKLVVTYSSNKDKVRMVIEYITPVVLELICSPVDVVRVKALWLLRNLVYRISKSSIEEALAPVISIILEDSIGYGLLHAASEILLVVCGVHPNLSCEKLKLALSALMKLIKSNVLTLLTSGCWGLARLCDGREEMIVEHADLKCLIRRLVNIMNSEERAMVIAGIHALGSIARWGSDDVIEAIIEDEGSLPIFSILLEEGDMYLVKQICWIISNITARKDKHIKAVIDGVSDYELIGPLVNVVENCEMNDVVEEALWAISNAMCGVGLDQIECLRKSCLIKVWRYETLNVPWVDILLLLVLLEGFVNIKMAEVTCNGRQIDGIELRLIFKNIVQDIDLSTQYGILSCDDNAEKSDGGVAYHLLFMWLDIHTVVRPLCLGYDSLKKEIFITS